MRYIKSDHIISVSINKKNIFHFINIFVLNNYDQLSELLPSDKIINKLFF
jgi:hypothetical protein